MLRIIAPLVIILLVIVVISTKNNNQAPDNLATINTIEHSAVSRTTETETIPDKIPDTQETVATADTPSISDDNITSETYSITPGSTILWLGKKTGGQHNGTLAVTDGTVTVIDGQITAGSITLDMTSITATDIDSPKLDEHLQADDYFDTANHPTATFDLIAITDSTVQGNLTIKETSKTIEFPATVAITNDTITINASFTLDRTIRGVNGGTPVVSKYMELSFTDLTRERN